MRTVRTTVTLDADVEELVRRLMHERGLSFKQAVNEAIRRSLGKRRRGQGDRTPTFRMGFEPSVPWDKALALTARLEDDERERRLTGRT